MNEPGNTDKSKAVTGYFVPVTSGVQNTTGNIIDLGELISRFRLILVAGTVLGGLLGLALAFLLTPQYRVEVLLAPVEQSGSDGRLGALAGQLGGLGALAGIDLVDSTDRDESLAILRSKALTIAFLQEEKLLPVLFASEWNGQDKQWKSSDPSDIPSTEDGYRIFDQEIRQTVFARDTGLVTLSIKWRDRGQATRWANLLVDRANSVIRDRAIDEYELSIEYLNQELEKTNIVEVRQAIYRVIESQIEKVMLANVREEYAFKVLDPAVVPDADDTAYPNKPLIALSGLILGFAISAFVAFLLARSAAENTAADLAG